MLETFYRVLIIIACFIVGYLCGSIPNGVIISKIFSSIRYIISFSYVVVNFITIIL